MRITTAAALDDGRREDGVLLALNADIQRAKAAAWALMAHGFALQGAQPQWVWAAVGLMDRYQERGDRWARVAQEWLNNQEGEDMESEGITVRQLMALLGDQDPEARVIVEGCDCIADAVGVTPMPTWEVHHRGVMIRRDPGAFLGDREDYQIIRPPVNHEL